jgi:hypothetical protein
MQVLGCVALFFASGCGDGRDAPEVFLVRATPDAVEFFWTHPRGEAKEGYSIELSVAGGQFLPRISVPPSETAYMYVFDDRMDPEQTNYAFRVRALPEGDGSRASEPLMYRRGVVTPLLFYGRLVGTSFELTWQPAAISPDLFQLERRSLAFDARFFPISDWTVILAPARATSYSDTDLSGWVHSTAYEYRLTAIAPDGERGEPVSAFTGLAPP